MKISYKRKESREKLSRKLGVTQQHLYRIEKQGYLPSLSLLIKLSQLCGPVKIEDDNGKLYLFIPLEFDCATIDPIEFIDIQKESENIASIDKDTLVKAFKQNNAKAQSEILKECLEAYSVLGEALCS